MTVKELIEQLSELDQTRDVKIKVYYRDCNSDWHYAKSRIEEIVDTFVNPIVFLGEEL